MSKYRGNRIEVYTKAMPAAQVVATAAAQPVATVKLVVKPVKVVAPRRW